MSLRGLAAGLEMGWSTVLFSLVFLFWGEVFSLFSATTGDVFASKNASANYGVVYSDEGVSFLLAGFGAAALAAYFGGSFAEPFYSAAVLCGVAALLSLFVLRPLVRSRIAKEVPGISVSRAAAEKAETRKEKERERKRVGARVVAGVSVEEPAMRDGGGKLTSAELLEKPAEVEEAACEVSTGLPVSDAAEARVPLTRQTVSALRLRACASKYSCARPSKATRSFWAGPLISVSAK